MPSPDGNFRAPGDAAPRMTQPVEMRTEEYVYGVEKLNGHDAWALFAASAAGELPKSKALLANDPRLVNAQYWYQLPIHLAVYAGHAPMVKLLLNRGADPGQSIYTYNSWDKLLCCARERGFSQIESLLARAMKQRFNYAPQFDLLKEAIVAHDVRKINAVVRRRPDLATASDALGNNALHWSVLTRQLGLIDRFAELGTPIDAQRADGQTPLLLAASGGTDYWYRETRGRSHPSLRNTWLLAGSLLAHGAKYTISVASAAGDQERVDELLRKDPGSAARLDSARISPLSYAAREGHLHLVRLLLAHGADPNMPENAAPRGRALFEACVRNHVEVARLLLEHGADPNAGTDSNECCLTIGKIYHGDRAKPLQELLRKHGAYPPPYSLSARELKRTLRENHEVIRRDEFLGNVIAKRDAELLDLVLDSDPHVTQRWQSSSGVAYPRSGPLVRRLLERGLDPNRPDWLGKTFLHAAAENGDRAVGAVLLDAGADINARDLEFQGTPLAAAVRACGAGADRRQAERRRMIRFLLKRGAKTNSPDDQPWATPLAWARQQGLADVEELLLKHGAQ